MGALSLAAAGLHVRVPVHQASERLGGREDAGDDRRFTQRGTQEVAQRSIVPVSNASRPVFKPLLAMVPEVTREGRNVASVDRRGT